MLQNILADTGADISMLPRNLGEALVLDITRAKKVQIKGVVPEARVNVYIHTLKCKLNSKQFNLPVAIADSDNVPPIFGRVKGLDLFNANFKKGKVLQLSQHKDCCKDKHAILAGPNHEPWTNHKICWQQPYSWYKNDY